MERPRWQVWTSHVLALLSAVAIGGAGFAKLLSTPDLVANFERWGFPPWFVYFTGALELLGAALVLAPRTRVIGAGVMGFVMLAAAITHLRAGELSEIVAPLVLGAMAVAAGALAWPRR